MKPLAEKLPDGERMLWQGKPSPVAFLKQIFHLQLVVAYVGLLLGWCLVTGAQSGHLLDSLMAAARFAGLSAVAVALFAALAWGLAWSTTYTITTARVVIQYGLALPKSISIPFASVDGAMLRNPGAAAADLVLDLRSGQRVSYLLLWPHVRPGSLRRAQPMLRALADSQAAAQILSRGLGGVCRHDACAGGGAGCGAGSRRGGRCRMSGAIRRVPSGQGGGVPFLALAGAGAAVVIALIVAAIGGSPVTMPPAAVEASRLLRFDDASNGSVLVTDAETGKRVAVLAPGTNGFIRATLRGLSHSGGHEEHVRDNHPFRLTALSDGRLTLDDPEAKRKLDLEAFGSLNAGAFAALLSTPEQNP